MAGGLLILIALCIIMGAASFLAGMLPLSLSLSPRQLRLITALGTGVLVGTSLIVIIPEGVETLYAASWGGSSSHNARSIAIASRVASVQSDGYSVLPRGHFAGLERDTAVLEYEGTDTAFRTGPDDGFPSDDDVGNADGHDTSAPGGHSTGDDSADHDPHVWIGISLILGFILMYLIDTLPQFAVPSSAPQRFQISLNQFSLNRTPSAPNDAAEIQEEDSSATLSNGSGGRPSSTTVGLVIHAAADGIALGASSTNGSSKLSFIIFIALMIHKAPAAFGLTSVLLKQGLSKRMAKAHLIVFSLAAPVGALLTWIAVHLLGFSSDALGKNANAEFATGVLLLFSGGTFLYVAMHTMQESGSAQHSHGEGNGMNGYAGVPMDDPYSSHASPPPKPQSTAFVDTMVTVGGMLLPLLTQFGHGH